MKQELYQAEWLGLDQKLRDKLKEIFAINRSEGMKVLNGKLASDGCSQNDLTNGITIGKMIEYTGDLKLTINTGGNNDNIFNYLFEIVIAKVSGKIKTKELNSNNKEKDVVIQQVEVDGKRVYAERSLGKELNSNINQNEETNKGTESESKGIKTESKGDKQTVRDGDDRPSGDDSVNAGSGDRQDIQRPKAKDKSKRAGHSSGKGTDKSKKAR